jgi:hypothetical protein
MAASPTQLVPVSLLRVGNNAFGHPEFATPAIEQVGRLPHRQANERALNLGLALPLVRHG